MYALSTLYAPSHNGLYSGSHFWMNLLGKLFVNFVVVFGIIEANRSYVGWIRVIIVEGVQLKVCKAVQREHINKNLNETLNLISKTGL